MFSFFLYVIFIKKTEIYDFRFRKGEHIVTDKQLEVIMNLIADKFDACKDMEEVKKARKIFIKIIDNIIINVVLF